MANFQIQIKNADKLLRAFRQAPEIMTRRLQEVIVQLGGFTTGEVKKHITAGTDMWKSPILTGTMRRGIQPRQVGKLKVIVSSSDMTPYALFVHEGTKFMKARPFFEITAKRSEKQIEDFFAKGIDKAVQDIIKQSK